MAQRRGQTNRKKDPPVLPGEPSIPRIIQEPILAMKIYDSCRHKNCLGRKELGAARDHEGRPIEPPEGAQSASIENLRLRRIIVLSKEPCPFKRGYWDTEIKYVFEYDLRFIGQEGVELDIIHATNSFNRRSTLFGSFGQDITIFTDVSNNGDAMMSGDPFILVEAKAMALSAKISDECHPHHPEPMRPQVFVTIGLFSIIKLYRMVSLLVESRGFVIPGACRSICPPNPCDFFEGLDFPMDAFAPPQKREFMAGISTNIPAEMADAGIEEIETEG
jgi:hypothetical protein